MKLETFDIKQNAKSRGFVAQVRGEYITIAGVPIGIRKYKLDKHINSFLSQFPKPSLIYDFDNLTVNKPVNVYIADGGERNVYRVVFLNMSGELIIKDFYDYVILTNYMYTNNF